MIVAQGHTVLAVGESGGMLEILSLHYHIYITVSLSLGDGLIDCNTISESC